jgi:hypothetical protein
MGILVTREAVKRAAAVSSTTYDAQIDALIADLVPVIEYTLSSDALSDSAAAAVLSRGATEIIAGEFLAQRLREEGATESFEAGGVRVGESPHSRADLGDPYGLIQRGWARLMPFLKPVYTQSTTRDRERQVTEQAMTRW